MGSKPHASDIDLYIIEQVKKKRLEQKMSQLALSQALSAADSFVSNVESSKYRTKYNVRHLNEIAQILNCSPKDFWPDKPF